MPHCAAAFICIAPIMPQAIGSGKPRQRRANKRFFPLSEMSRL
jgi:hypothetical protein